MNTICFRAGFKGWIFRCFLSAELKERWVGVFQQLSRVSLGWEPSCCRAQKKAWQRLHAAVSCTSRNQRCQAVGCSRVHVFTFLRLMGQILWAAAVLPLVQAWSWGGTAAFPSSSQGGDEHQPNESSRVLGDVPPDTALLQGSC